MNMKKIIATVLAMTMAFSMVACGGEKADERRIANLTEEEAKVIEIFAGAYEGMELEDIKADFATEDLEALKAEIVMEGADKEAYIALLDEMHAAEEMTVEEAIKYAVLNRFYVGLNLVANPDMEMTGEMGSQIPTEEELAPYRELAAQGKLYAKLFVALADYIIANPEAENLDRLAGMGMAAGFQMLGDMLADAGFGEMMEEAVDGIIDATTDVEEEIAEPEEITE